MLIWIQGFNVVFQVLAGFLGALLLFFNLVNKSIRYFLTKNLQHDTSSFGIHLSNMDFQECI